MEFKERGRCVSLDYLRVIAVFMILYDHLGCLRNSGWMVKKAADYFLAVPLDIIQDFGAFGVSIFFVISGFLFAWNGKYEKLCRNKLRKIILIYLSNIIAFLGFWAFQNVVWIFRDSYWQQFTVRQWLESMTLVGYFAGKGDVINGTTWFLLPLGMFYMVEILYGAVYKKAGWKCIYIVEGVLAVVFLTFHVMDVQIANLLIFVYMPMGGTIMAELMKAEGREKIRIRALAIAAVVNYIQMILCFHRFNRQYYLENRYLVSYMYAMMLTAFFLLFGRFFEEKKWCRLLCKISLAVYLLQMTWGSFLMQVLSHCGVLFTAAFLVTVLVILLLGWFHSFVLEDRVLKRFIYKN